MTPANVADYRELARRRTPKVLFDYAEGGSYTEDTLRRNMADFALVRLRQRVLRDVSEISMATSVFGQDLAMPVMLAPIGMGGLYARRGEAQAARAAAKAGIAMILSTMSICALDEVRAACEPPIWFQLYMLKDRGFMADLLARARSLGCPALVFTVDLPVPGSRYRDVRNGLNGPMTPGAMMGRAWDGLTHLPWVWDVFLKGRPHIFGNVAPAIPEARELEAFWPWVRRTQDAALTWDDIAWVRSHWPGPLILKGVLDPEDARAAADNGVDGLVVSNHGGRQLDGALSAISALPAVAEAVGDRMTVLMDGGVRSGLDVLKAVACGAKACLIGRAWVYGLAGGGRAGVEHVLDIIRGELRTALALTGCTDVRRAGPDLLARLDK